MNYYAGLKTNFATVFRPFKFKSQNWVYQKMVVFISRKLRLRNVTKYSDCNT